MKEVKILKTWRPTADDVKLLAEKAKLGQVSEAAVLRLGLRALAQSGVVLN